MIWQVLLFVSSLSLSLDPPIWSTTKNVAYLADRVGSAGVIAVTHDGKALLLGSDGKVQASYKVPNATRVLRFEAKSDERPASLVAMPRQTNLISGEPYFPGEIVFGQGQSVITVGSGCTVLTPDSSFSLPSLDANGAIGVSSDGKAVAHIECPMYVPILTEYTQNGRSWSRNASPLTPMIEEVGFARPLDRFSDIRYVGANYIVYIGSVLALRPMTDREIGNKLDPLLKGAPFDLQDRAAKRAALFVVNLRTRVTQVLADVNVADDRERGGPSFGRLAVSADSKYIFLACRDGIARIETAQYAKG